MQADLNGKATFTIDGKDYTIDVAKDDDATAIGTKLATALDGKIDDGLELNMLLQTMQVLLRLRQVKWEQIIKQSSSAYKPLENGTTVTDIYNKMKDELATASSIGTDTAATVTNNNDGTFTHHKRFCFRC